MIQRNPKKDQKLEERNEKLLLGEMDTKRIYFNSIHSKIEPKFKFKKRQQHKDRIHKVNLTRGLWGQGGANDVEDLCNFEGELPAMKSRAIKTAT